MTTQTAQNNTHTNPTTNCFCTIPFSQINEPGCYVCNWSGHLLRVPDDGVVPGRSPLITMVGSQQLFVTKICQDPFVTITKARLLACDCDCNVNF